MTPDAVLLRRFAQDRDEAAFRELIERYVDGVYSSALRRVGGDRHFAEDVTQKVFVELAHQAARLVEHPFLAGWIFRITGNQAANVVRAERRRKQREAQAAMMNDINTGNAQADWDRLAPLLDAAIDRLRDSDRAVVLLRFINRKSFAEIGALQCVSEDAARMRVDRALEKLRVYLTRYGISSTAAALGLLLEDQSVGAAPTYLVGAVSGTVAKLSLGGAAPHFVFIKSMSISKAVAAAAGGVLLFLSLGMALREYDIKNDALERFGSEQLEYYKNTKEISRVDQAITRANFEKSELEKQLASARAKAGPGAPDSAVKWDPQIEGDAFLKKHPEVARLLAEWRDAVTDMDYGKLYKVLNFSADKINQFRAIMRGNSGLSFPIDPERDEYVNLSINHLQPGEWSRQFNALVGKENLPLVERMGPMDSSHRLASEFGITLSSSEEPLTATQSAQISDTFTRFRNPSTGPGFEQFPDHDWNAILKEAGLYLSPQQLTALGDLRAASDYERVYAVKQLTAAIEEGKRVTKANRSSP